MSTLKEETLQLHEVHRGKLAVSLKVTSRPSMICLWRIRRG